MTIALCAIVRDEQHVIERCLNSAHGLADSYVIVDTGSTDRTCELIEAHPLPGQLHHSEWVDFGHNRTELMDLAYGKADWLLLLDADMTAVHDGPPQLDPGIDAYLVRHDDDPSYWIKRLVSGRRRWRFEGVTHEFITCDDEGGTITARLDSIAVRHHADGGHRPEKFERDLALLEQEHHRNPEDPRTAFYLASTLRDLGQSQKAADMFLKCAGMNGWDEERFYSLYEAGRLASDLELLWQAWSARPTRAEPLYEIAVHQRERRSWAVAHLAAQIGAQLPVPDDTLFVHRWIYEWGCEFELSVAAWWAGQHDQARKATERLLACPTLPGNYRQQVIQNMEYLK